MGRVRVGGTQGLLDCVGGRDPVKCVWLENVCRTVWEDACEYQGFHMIHIFSRYTFFQPKNILNLTKIVLNEFSC